MKKTILFLLILLLFLNYSATAKEDKDEQKSSIKLDISINKEELLVDEGFIITLKFSVEGKSNNNSAGPEIDEIPNDNPDISIKLIGTSSSITIVNGKVSKTNIYNFYVLIKKQGNYEIKPFIIKYQGKKYKTELLKIEVIHKILI